VVEREKWGFVPNEALGPTKLQLQTDGVTKPTALSPSPPRTPRMRRAGPRPPPRRVAERSQHVSLPALRGRRRGDRGGDRDSREGAPV